MSQTMKQIVFSKPLTRTDIDKRLSIPANSLALLPSFCGGKSLELLVRDENGCTWTFNFSVRKTGYSKPVIQQGWRDFVLARGLNVDDKVTLYRQESDDGVRVLGTVLPRSCYSIEVEKA